MERSGMLNPGGRGGSPRRTVSFRNYAATIQNGRILMFLHSELKHIGLTNCHMNSNIPNTAMKSMTATDCADRITLMDYRLFLKQQCMLDCPLKEITTSLILKERARLVYCLAKINAVSGAEVGPRFAIKDFLGHHQPQTYREYCDGREDTIIDNSLVRSLCEHSGGVPFEVHTVLLNVNPVIAYKDDHALLTIKVCHYIILREVVHALGGVMEGEEKDE